MAQAYDFALEKVGLDVQSYQCYADYVSFLKSVYIFITLIFGINTLITMGIFADKINLMALIFQYLYLK